MPRKKVADRLREAIRLHMQGRGFENSLITIRDTNSNRDRVTSLPDEGQYPRHLHLAQVCRERNDAMTRCGIQGG